MLKPLMAHLEDLPHEPESEPGAWRLECGAPCGCRDELGAVRVHDAAAHLWCICLPDRYQPQAPGLWVCGKSSRRPKLQPWATGSGIAPAPAILDGTRQPVVEVSDMRQRDEHGHPEPVGHLVGPLGVGRTPSDVVIVCPCGHHNHVTVEHIEEEVSRLRQSLALS
jgi:hypothetical protein